MFDPCPRCGSADGFYVTARAYGPVEIHFDLAGSQAEMETDRMRFEASETVRCVGCTRIRRDLVCKGREIQLKPPEAKTHG